MSVHLHLTFNKTGVFHPLSFAVSKSIDPEAHTTCASFGETNICWLVPWGLKSHKFSFKKNRTPKHICFTPRTASFPVNMFAQMYRSNFVECIAIPSHPSYPWPCSNRTNAPAFDPHFPYVQTMHSHGVKHSARSVTAYLERPRSGFSIWESRRRRKKTHLLHTSVRRDASVNATLRRRFSFAIRNSPAALSQPESIPASPIGRELQFGRVADVLVFRRWSSLL